MTILALELKKYRQLYHEALEEIHYLKEQVAKFKGAAIEPRDLDGKLLRDDPNPFKKEVNDSLMDQMDSFYKKGEWK